MVSMTIAPPDPGAKLSCKKIWAIINRDPIEICRIDFVRWPPAFSIEKIFFTKISESRTTPTQQHIVVDIIF